MLPSVNRRLPSIGKEVYKTEGFETLLLRDAQMLVFQ